VGQTLFHLGYVWLHCRVLQKLLYSSKSVLDEGDVSSYRIHLVLQFLNTTREI